MSQSQMEIKSPSVSVTDLMAQIEALKAENEALKVNKAVGHSFKITEKGGLSVYGLGRFPVTLYKSQWLKLLDMAQTIRDFIRVNESKLTDKPQTEKVAA